jgi:hypothetical protein
VKALMLVQAGGFEGLSGLGLWEAGRHERVAWGLPLMFRLLLTSLVWPQ